MSKIAWPAIAVVVLAATVYWCLYSGGPSAAMLDAVRGKRVLITGASSGIGEEIAYVYSRLGASILLTARRAHLLKTVAAKCKELGAERVEYVAADMAIPLHRHKVLNETKRFFNDRLDHLLLIHGMIQMSEWSGSADDLANFRHVLEVNFLSYVDMASMCLDMLRASRGNIGVMSSLGGKVAHPYSAMYSPSKFALQGFFGSIRQELKWAGDNVSVTLFALGLVRTDKMSDVMSTYFPKGLSFAIDNAADVRDTANVVVRSVINRVYEVQYPPVSWFVIQVHKLFPSFLEDQLAKQLHSLYRDS